MRIHYGYTDASGDYRITIDTELCDGCGKCVDVCPKELYEVVEDDMDIDNDSNVARIKKVWVKEIGIQCPGYERCRSDIGSTCHEVCPHSAISHTW